MTDIPRRTLLLALAASPVAVAGLGTFPRAARAQAASAGLVTPNVCLVAPETTEGPFYFDPVLERVDITEGKPGTAMELTLQVVDASCTPVENARVDIWHCDAQGNYSGYATQGSDATNDTAGETFLRGTQVTDAAGTARFTTIYPGWYRGRTTHIHYKVFLDETTLLTSQIFFPEAVSQAVFGTDPAYARSTPRTTVNANDGILRRAGDGAFSAVAEESGRLTAAMVVGIAPGALSG